VSNPIDDSVESTASKCGRIGSITSAVGDDDPPPELPNGIGFIGDDGSAIRNVLHPTV
jgi:hypothetical protein